MSVILHIAVTWLGLMSLAFALAILAFRLPPFLGSSEDRSRLEPIASSFMPLFATLIGVIAATSVGDLLLRTMSMIGDSPSEGFSVLTIVLRRTHYGTVWLVRIATLTLLAVLLLFRSVRDRNSFRVLAAALGVVIAWTYSASGHASDQGDFTVPETVDLLHLLAASAWAGGVTVLAVTIVPSCLARGDLVTLAEASRRFSRMAGFAVHVVILTAICNVLAYVGGLRPLWTTGYGLVVSTKMTLLYLLMLTGGFNRYISVPLLLHVAGGRLEPPGMIGRMIGVLLDMFRHYLTTPVTALFRKALLVETVLMAAVLMCAAVLKHQTPPLHLRHLEHQHRAMKTIETCPGSVRTLKDFHSYGLSGSDNRRQGGFICDPIKCGPAV